MLDYVMTRNNVMPRMNARVLGAAQKYVDLSQHTGLSVLITVFDITQYGWCNAVVGLKNMEKLGNLKVIIRDHSFPRKNS